jgi:uncharacterized protein YdhG (YjbR/CyaY superfamily)
VGDIAAAAHVAVPTVYASVGPKPAILGELRKQIPVLAGVPEDTRGAIAQVSDPVRLISGFVAGLRRLLETSGDLMFAIEAAAPFEAVAAEAWEEGLVIHRAAWGIAVQRLEALGALKQTLHPAKAADILSFLSLPATWRTLSHDHGWTYDQVEAWIVQTAITLALEPSPAPRTNAPPHEQEISSLSGLSRGPTVTSPLTSGRDRPAGRRLPVWACLLLRLIDQHNGTVSAQEIDQYLDALEEPKRTTLARLRQTILQILPEADQGISYGVPAFKVGGKTIAGFAAFKNHLSYLPHSGSVFPQLQDELKGYATSSGALRFGIDEPLPVPLVEKLIAVRLRQAFPA